jgi:hypothetical protein
MDLDSPFAAGSMRASVGREELCQRLLVVLARAQLAGDGTRDQSLAQLQRCVRAALFVLDFKVPWVSGEQGQIRAWAEQPDEYTESEVVQDLLLSGLAGIALGRLQPAFVVYHWLRTVVQDARDLNLVWGVALLGARQLGRARACFAQLDGQDELAEVLMAVTLLDTAPAEAVQHLKRIQAGCVPPPVGRLVREVLKTLDHDRVEADLAELDPAEWIN